MIVAAAVKQTKHHSAFHRFFANAAWSLDGLGLNGLLPDIEPWITGTIFLAIDDTLARKRGFKVFGVGMHHDPLSSTRKTAPMNWGHSWVVLGVAVPFLFRRDRYFCLPILFRLYLNHKGRPSGLDGFPERGLNWPSRCSRSSRNRRKNRAFHVVADSTYGGQSVFKCLPINCDPPAACTWTPACMHPAAPPRNQRATAKRGKRPPTPRQMFEGRMERRTLDLYGRRDRVRIAQTMGRWHCALDRPLRVVAVDPLSPEVGRVRLFIPPVTRPTASRCSPGTAIVGRWKNEPGIQRPSRVRRASRLDQGRRRRTAPMAMLLYSLIVLWFASEGHRHYTPLFRPWYRTKRGPCFVDMLATLRRPSVRQQVSSWGLRGAGLPQNPANISNKHSLTQHKNCETRTKQLGVRVNRTRGSLPHQAPR